MTWAAIQAVVTLANTLTGSLKLQASNDAGSDTGTLPATGITNWTDITSSSQSITGNGANMWNLADIGYRWIRLVWTKSGGTGTLTATANAKGIS